MIEYLIYEPNFDICLQYSSKQILLDNILLLISSIAFSLSIWSEELYIWVFIISIVKRSIFFSDIFVYSLITFFSLLLLLFSNF
jgi:hypothetical protein